MSNKKYSRDGLFRPQYTFLVAGGAVQTAPSDEKENPRAEMAFDKQEGLSVQMVLPSYDKENLQMEPESVTTMDSHEGPSAQPDAAARLPRAKEKDVNRIQDTEIENPASKSECVTPLLIKSEPNEHGLTDEAVTATESKNQFIDGSVPLVKTDDATDLKSTSQKSVNTNLDIKTEVKPEELKNVSKRKEKKASKFNFVKKLKKLVPLSVDSKVHSACLVVSRFWSCPPRCAVVIIIIFTGTERILFNQRHVLPDQQHTSLNQQIQV